MSKKYKWYPNRDITSPTSAYSVASPSPKKINRFNKRSEMATPNMKVAKNMITSINKDLRKQQYEAASPNVGMH